MNSTRFFSYRLTFFAIVVLISFFATLALYGYFKRESSFMDQPTYSSAAKTGVVRFMPIGDSYTIGLGVSDESLRWPNLLVESLGREGIRVELIDNPAVSGYEVDDAIREELPLFEQAKPDLGTLFIGANDSFRKKELSVFEKEYRELLDRMQKSLSSPSQLVLITIPNYARFPAGVRYGATEREEQMIDEYNAIIRKLGQERGLQIVDLYGVDSMNSSEFFIADGLHPNARGIQVWHDAIFSVVKNLLLNRD